MIVCRYVCLFILYSMMGWVFESFLCTVNGKKWENRGFLYGPSIPIYGAGATAATILLSETERRGIALEPWQVFLISVLGSAVLEYTTSWTLEKLFHAMWWDYSDLPFNLNGRISLFTSLGFGIAGLVIFYGIAPVTTGFVTSLHPVFIEFLALFLLAVFTSDLTLTVTALIRFDKIVTRMEDHFNRNMESIVDSTVQQTSNLKQGITEKQKWLSARIGYISGGVGQAVARIRSFRDPDEKKKTTKTFLRSLFEKVS